MLLNMNERKLDEMCNGGVPNPYSLRLAYKKIKK